MNDIFLGKLPTMVQGTEPLGEEIIAKLRKYAEDQELLSYELTEDSDGNFTATELTK